MDLCLLCTVFSELILNKVRELLFFTNLNLSIKVLQTALVVDLLHVQVKDVLVAHLIVAHEDALSELVDCLRCMNEGQASFGRGSGRVVARAIPVISDALELRFSILGVRVG